MSIPKPINRLIGQAMHTYRMLDDGDRVMIAVSGGIDSLVLTAVLSLWQKKAPISYTLFPVHIDMGFKGAETESITRQLARLVGGDMTIVRTTFGPDALAEEERGGCFRCARNRRTSLFSMAREKGYNKLALGHHKEDIIETFFINLLYSGNLSTMVPNQSLFNGNLTVIRPLAYLDKDQIRQLASSFGLTPVANPCPLSGATKREHVRRLLDDLYRQDPHIKGNIFSALANVRPEYLLTPPDTTLPR